MGFGPASVMVQALLLTIKSKNLDVKKKLIIKMMKATLPKQFTGTAEECQRWMKDNPKKGPFILMLSEKQPVSKQIELFENLKI